MPLLVLAGLFPSAALAQTDLSAKLETIRAANDLPAMAGIVVKDARIIAQGVTGVRRVGSTAPLTLDDRINVGSCTKFLTATVAARLIDRGLIQWTSRVRDVFPDKVSVYNSGFLDATLDDILAHRSGAEDNTTFNNNHWYAFSFVTGNTVQLRAWVTDAVLSDSPQVAHGTFLYSNNGYSVAATMLERVSGKSWEQLIQDEVFTPLRMTTAHLGISFDDNLPPTGPVGHDFSGPGARAATPQTAFTGDLLAHYEASNGPGGTLVCTLADYAKFLNEYAGSQADTYLTTATRTKILTPWVTGRTGDGTSNDAYAHGVFSLAQPWATPGNALNHLGDIFGQDTLFWSAPGRNLIMITYANCSETDARTGTALNAEITQMINAYSATTVKAAGPYLEGPSNGPSVKTGTTFTLTTNTLPTGVYQLQTSTNNMGTWTNIGAAVTAKDWTTKFTGAITGTQHPFYRVTSVP